MNFSASSNGWIRSEKGWESGGGRGGGAAMGYISVHTVGLVLLSLSSVVFLDRSSGRAVLEAVGAVETAPGPLTGWWWAVGRQWAEEQ